MNQPDIGILLDTIVERLNFTDHVLVTDTFLDSMDREQNETKGFIHAVMAIRDGQRPDFSYTETPRQKWQKALKERHLVAEYLPQSFLYRVRNESTA